MREDTASRSHLPSTRALLTPTHTWSCLTPMPQAHARTHTHRRTCPARCHHPHAGTALAHLTPTSHFPDTLAHTHDPRKRQHLHAQTDRRTEVWAWPVKGPQPRSGLTKQAAREPLPAASPGPVPCPPMPAPASWGAAPRTPAGPGRHLERRRCGGAGAAQGGRLLARRVVLPPCSYLWNLLEA